MTNVWVLVLCAAIAYILGSISFSYLFTKKIRHEDIREKGSGNAGTTNVLRNYGWGMGVLVFAGDVLKGLLAALIGMYLGGELGLCVAGVFAVVGHNYSCFLRFKGGKGILSAVAAFVVAPDSVYQQIAVVIIAILGILSHRENIVRLIHGNERKLSLSKK